MKRAEALLQGLDELLAQAQFETDEAERPVFPPLSDPEVKLTLEIAKAQDDEGVGE
jgi:hypothetical protein